MSPTPQPAPENNPSSPTLTPALLMAVVFVEGFSSLGAEVLALRRLVPHLGSAITVTAPTIGFFLLALALGYQAGGKVAADFLPRVRRNFLLAASLILAGLAGPVVEALFAHVRPAPIAYLLFISLILCPVAYLLGQTVPVLTNLLRHERAGARSGAALYWSTLGSFLGSISLSLLVMQWLGVSAAVLVCAGLLLVLVPLLPAGTGPRWQQQLAPAASLALGLALNLGLPQQVETAYATYSVDPVQLPGMQDARVFRVNNSTASLLDSSEPPRYARYIERLRRLFLEDLGYRDKRILVLGAGGFSLSHQEPLNDYTYVDIDPAIKALAEKEFLRQPIQGRFVAEDARRYVVQAAEAGEHFDAVVVDVYSALTSIPAHLVTWEFWLGTRRALAPEGVMVANLILDQRLATPYARNLLATIESVYGPCAVEILFRDRPQSNVLIQCFAGPEVTAAQPYTDEKNRADLDLARSR